MPDTTSLAELSGISPAMRAAVAGCADRFAPPELHAVDLAAARWGEARPDVLLALLLAARAPRVGHAGVSLTEVATSFDGQLPPSVPVEAREWLARVASSPLVAVHGAGMAAPPPGPFVLQVLTRGPDGEPAAHLLLTGRMDDTQRRVAELLRVRAAASQGVSPDLDARVEALFPEDPRGEAATAVRVAATGRLTIVTGGPGTGKTYSIARLLALALAADPELSIVLAAPTGKARARMREALLEQVAQLAAPPAVRAALGGLQAETIHRLVGLRPDGTCRHHADNPLPAGLVVVDEVSMVDLVLMRALLEAIAPDARLVLLGDRDQLASVEAGTVLADLVAAASGVASIPDGASKARPQTSDGPLAGRVVRFTRSRRFASAPDIAEVAACLQSGRPDRLDRAVDLMVGRLHAEGETLRGPLLARIRHLGDRLDVLSGTASQPALGALVAPYLAGRGAGTEAGYAALLAEAFPNGAACMLGPSYQAGVLDALEHFRVLGVTRAGPRGVEGLDRAIGGRVREALREAWRAAGLGVLPQVGPHWLGRPLIVTRNAPDVRLSNGDVGLVLPVAVSGEGVKLGAVFRVPGGVRAVPLGRLPPHEGGLAMTIHKSQGSQFDRVALVLAGHAGLALQTRELVYTGLTRAKARVDWLGTEQDLRGAFTRTVSRASSLAQLLGG